MKLAVIILGVALLILLLVRSLVEMTIPRTEGEYLSLQEAGNLTWLLADTGGVSDSKTIAAVFSGDSAAQSDGMLTFAQWKDIAGLFPDCTYELPGGYRNKDKVLQDDWYPYFDAVRAVYDKDGRIQDMDLTPIGLGGSFPTQMETGWKIML